MWQLGSVLLMLLIGSCSAGPQEMGTLEGHVAMTMAPVLREGMTEPTPVPEAYAIRQIVILRQDGRKEIARGQIGPQGDYRVQLLATPEQVLFHLSGNRQLP